MRARGIPGTLLILLISGTFAQMYISIQIP
jgi:hypothetical protein